MPLLTGESIKHETMDMSELHAYIQNEYLSRGMSYGDYLAFLCNHMNEWSSLPDMADLIGQSGLSLNDAVAYQGRLMAVRDNARAYAVLNHNLNIVDYGHCVDSVTCWACTRKSDSNPLSNMYGPIH